jgi:signal transduction histidine kinase/CheY-like chemotaxis protein
VSTSGTTARPLRILMVEDSSADATLVLAELRRRGYAPIWRRVETADDMRTALAEESWECVLSDHQLPRFSGLAALRILQESGQDLPFIVVSGAIGEETAAAAMKAGAHDYVLKHALSRLGPALERELGDVEVRRERRRVAAALADDTAVAAALQRVGQTLITSLAAPDLLTALCRVTAEVLGCDSSHTLFWQPEAQVFRPVANHGATPDEQAVARAVAVPRAMMATLLDRLTTDDVTEVTPTPVDLLATPRHLASRQLCVALRCGEELIGIQVASRRDSFAPFTTVQRRVGRGIAQLASMTLEHARVRQELEQSNRLKSDFVATMSHELRTPLNIIMGYTDLLRDGAFGGISGEQHDALMKVDRSARDLLELINATLDLSRLERGLAPLDVESIDLAPFLRDVVAALLDNDRKPAVQVETEIAPDLPTLRTDPVKLKVILRNLLGNALKFTHHGTVALRARARAAVVEISVVDTGSGIDPEILPIIFEPFRQGGNANGTVAGVGLGLYVVRKLLDLLQGTIQVDSVPGRGTTFRVTLPRRIDHPSVPPTSECPPPA